MGLASENPLMQVLSVFGGVLGLLSLVEHILKGIANLRTKPNDQLWCC